MRHGLWAAVALLVGACGLAPDDDRQPLVVNQPPPPPSDPAPVDASAPGPRFEFLAAEVAGLPATHGQRAQFRFAGRVVNDGPVTVTKVTVDDAHLVWFGHTLPVTFPRDAPNPENVPPGRTSGTYFFITGVEDTGACLALPSPRERPTTGFVTLSFTATSNVFRQRFEDLAVGLDCPPEE